MVESLKTDSRREALVRVRPLVDAWKLRCQQWRGQGDAVAARAEFFRDALRKAKSAQERDIILDQVESVAEALDGAGRDSENDQYGPEAERFTSLALGRKTETLLAPLVGLWLDEWQVAQKTKDMARSNVNTFVGRYRTAEEVDRKVAALYVREALSPGRKRQTVQRKLTEFMQFWQWLQDRGYLPEGQRNPWAGQGPKIGRAAIDPDEGKRRPLTEDEAARLLFEVQESIADHADDLAVTLLLAVTGARLEEVASLQVRHVTTTPGKSVLWLHIRKGKTAAASRRIPVVSSSVVGMVLSRLVATEAAPLFPDLEVSARGSRSEALSKRLGKCLRRITDDPTVVAGHGWRHRARTLVEAADVNPWTADFFFGHARSGEGLERYSRPSDDQLIETAKAIPIPQGFVLKVDGQS